MAKFDNMVTTDFLKLTDEEVYTMEMHFINLAKEVFGTTFQFVNSSSVDGKGNELEYVSFNFKCNERKGRNPNGDRVVVKGFTINVRKCNGYLNNPSDNNDYSVYSTPIVQFLSWATVDGNMIKYRRKTEEPIHLNENFKFGTEVEDLDYKDTFNELKIVSTIR